MDDNEDPLESSSEAPLTLKKSEVQWFREILWWTAAMALLVICWGAVQFVGLLVQAERLRSALESGLNTAALPESTLASVCNRTEREIQSVVGTAKWQDRYYLNGNLRSLPCASPIPIDEQEFNTVRVELDVASRDVLPWWLGPRLIGFTPERTYVNWDWEGP